MDEAKGLWPSLPITQSRMAVLVLVVWSTSTPESASDSPTYWYRKQRKASASQY